MKIKYDIINCRPNTSVSFIYWSWDIFVTSLFPSRGFIQIVCVWSLAQLYWHIDIKPRLGNNTNNRNIPMPINKTDKDVRKTIYGSVLNFQSFTELRDVRYFVKILDSFSSYKKWKLIYSFDQHEWGTCFKEKLLS